VQDSETPLAGVRVLERAGLGPGPFGVMLLADLGAEVIRVDRPSVATGDPGLFDDQRSISRGRRSIVVDLKQPEGVELVLRLAETADVLVESNRPGVVERLGLGPEVCCARNDRLIYARMTGWGQNGPLSTTVGHDIDYAALAGALHPVGRASEPPPPPLNFLADFAGGGEILAIGVLAALLERIRSGRGQVIDVAMTDGTALLTAAFHGLMARGDWVDERESNLLDGAAPFYRTYRAADGRFVAVGALEPQFYAALLKGLELDAADWPQHDRSLWPAQRSELEAIFATRTRDEWVTRFAGLDACVAPVLSLQEAPLHEHNRARGTFVERSAGTWEPTPAPHFSRTATPVPTPAPDFGEQTDQILAELGVDDDAVALLRQRGVVA
jgi:alpha-methylacyl-CoA racemase